MTIVDKFCQELNESQTIWWKKCFNSSWISKEYPRKVLKLQRKSRFNHSKQKDIRKRRDKKRRRRVSLLNFLIHNPLLKVWILQEELSIAITLWCFRKRKELSRFLIWKVTWDKEEYQNRNFQRLRRTLRKRENQGWKK